MFQPLWDNLESILLSAPNFGVLAKFRSGYWGIKIIAPGDIVGSRIILGKGGRQRSSNVKLQLIPDHFLPTLTEPNSYVADTTYVCPNVHLLTVKVVISVRNG